MPAMLKRWVITESLEGMVSKNRPYGTHRNWRLAVVFGSFRASLLWTWPESRTTWITGKTSFEEGCYPNNFCPSTLKEATAINRKADARKSEKRGKSMCERINTQCVCNPESTCTSWPFSRNLINRNFNLCCCVIPMFWWFLLPGNNEPLSSHSYRFWFIGYSNF